MMPVLRGDLSDRPDWCELHWYEIVSVTSGGQWRWAASHERNMAVIVEGSCDVAERRLDRAGGSVELPAGEYFITSDDGAMCVLLGGEWGDDCGGVGVFGVVAAPERSDAGDPVCYPKCTNFDRHFHDCDEYWILGSGRGTAYSEGVPYEVGPGDCVATRMGHHHDFPVVTEPVSAVFFETTMRGRKRRGHLWEHTHGPAQPVADEIGGM